MTTTTTTQLLNDVDIEAVGALADHVRQDPDAAATQWRADISWSGGFRSSARIRGFEPRDSDEPAGLGGTDAAPNPVEQLLAALGNCLAVGYAANATARGIELEDIRVTVTGDLDLHSFLGLRPGHAGFSGITATVHLTTQASDAQVQALHEIVVGSSPVGHTLAAAVPVTIDLA